MTQHRPPACHYDRALGERVTTEHRDDCTDPSGHRGCVPCTALHCRSAAAPPTTTPSPAPPARARSTKTSSSSPRRTAPWPTRPPTAAEKADSSRPHPSRAAPPRSSAAQPFAVPLMRTFRGYSDQAYLEDHQPNDPFPPLAVLAHWEDLYRAWLGHAPAAIATVTRSVDYLRRQLPYIAQRTDGPDWHAFTREVRDIRSQLEHALHDGREPERGVECFECGDILERRWRRAAPCTHSTPARRELQRWAGLGYPEALTVADVRAAYQPCGACDQGGIEDPSAGQSWECPGCRKSYDPGEYAPPYAATCSPATRTATGGRTSRWRPRR